MKLTKDQNQILRYVGLILFIFFLNLLLVNIGSHWVNVDDTFINIIGVFIFICVILFDIISIMAGYNIYQKIQKMKEMGVDPKKLN